MNITFRRAIISAFCVVISCLSATSPDAAEAKPKFKVSYSQRIRIETTDNATSLSKESLAGSSYMRQRTSLMVQVYPFRRLETTVKLTNEMRYYFVPESRAYTFDEVICDLVYIKWDSATGLPVNLTLGRQDITLGEGFVVMEGGPLDGSRSGYFNAARVDWQASPKNAFTFVYANQPIRDNYLPVIHDLRKKMVEQPEEAFIASYSTTLGKTGLQAYFIRKNIDATSGIPVTTHVNCPGVRVQAPVWSGLSLTGEAAVQLGKRGQSDQQAFGGYAYAEYRTEWPLYYPRSFTLGGMYLSGDDLSTADYEGWEPLFGRWPKWSESYIYTLTLERGIAYWTNLASIFAKTAVDIAPDVTFSFDYHHLMAPQEGGPSRFAAAGPGRSRGELFIGKLAYKMSKRLSGVVIWESFNPKTYYFGGADGYAWMRMEVMLRF